MTEYAKEERYHLDSFLCPPLPSQTCELIQRVSLRKKTKKDRYSERFLECRIRYIFFDLLEKIYNSQEFKYFYAKSKNQNT